MDVMTEERDLNHQKGRHLPPAWQVLLLIVLFTAICAGFLLADETDSQKTEKANWQLAENWTPDKTHDLMFSTSVIPNWLPDGDRFWYRYLRADGRHYLLVDPAKKLKHPLFDRMKLAGLLSRESDEEVDGKDLDLGGLELDGDLLRFTIGEAAYEYDPAADSLRAVEAEDPAPGPEDWENRSPDGTLCVYARGNNLYVCDPVDPDGSEKQISSDGAYALSWGTEWELVPDEDTERRQVPAVWSADSSKFAILRADLREVGDLWLVDHLAQPRPTLKTYKCPFPGEKLPQWEIWIYHCSGDRMVRVQAERFEDQRLDDLFTGTLWWGGDSSTLFFPRRSRDFMKVDVCAADPASGMVQTLLEERIEGQVYIKDPIELPGGEGYLWWSMRDDWGHLYRYDTAARLLNQVTRGSWTVEDVLAVDGEKKVIFFTACGREKGRNPYYTHLYRVNYDGTGLLLLTPEDAEHEVVLGPDRTCFVDNCSQVDQPTRCLLRDMEGKLLLELESADVSKLVEAGWKPPEVFKAMSADGVTEQWGVIWKPFDFDPERKYPIATRVYPGRQDEYIPKSFQPVSAEATMAQLGMVVVRFGNRGGTPTRGLAYREYGREQFRDYGLADKRMVIEQLAKRHPWIDIERVGIYGGSSGGFMTVSAMLVDPDFWTVGVAMTAPNDPNIYYDQWVERYKGVKKMTDEDGSEHWEAGAETNVELAANLKGKLLMIYGAQDDNVHPAHLHRMADALIKAGKRFDMFVVPGADHGLGGWRYLYGMVWDYFAAHLIGDTPRPGVECLVPPPAEE